MGQYFELVNISEGVVFEQNFNTIGGMKLTEHSYLTNPLAVELRARLAWQWRNGRIAHLGDYASDGGSANDVYKKYQDILSDTENLEHQKIILEDVEKMDAFEYPYILNNDKKEYVDILTALPHEIAIEANENLEKFKLKLWVFDPVLMLTAVGNGMGGGDYSVETYPDYDLVGRWAGDRLSATNECQTFDLSGYKKLEPLFFEGSDIPLKYKNKDIPLLGAWIDYLLEDAVVYIKDGNLYRTLEIDKIKKEPKEIIYDRKYSSPLFENIVIKAFKERIGF